METRTFELRMGILPTQLFIRVMVKISQLKLLILSQDSDVPCLNYLKDLLNEKKYITRLLLSRSKRKIDSYNTDRRNQQSIYHQFHFRSLFLFQCENENENERESRFEERFRLPPLKRR